MILLVLLQLNHFLSKVLNLFLKNKNYKKQIVIFVINVQRCKISNYNLDYTLSKRFTRMHLVNHKNGNFHKINRKTLFETMIFAHH